MWVGGWPYQLKAKLYQLSTKLKLKFKLSLANHDFELVSEPTDILNKTAKIFTRKYSPCRTKKIPEQKRHKQIT